MSKRSANHRRDSFSADGRPASSGSPELSLEAILAEYRVGFGEEPETPEPEAPEAQPVVLEPEEDGVLSGAVQGGPDSPEEEQTPEYDETPEAAESGVRDFSCPPEPDAAAEPVPAEGEPVPAEGEPVPEEGETPAAPAPEQVEGYEDDADFYAGPLPEPAEPEEDEEGAEKQKKGAGRFFRPLAPKGNPFAQLSAHVIALLAAASIKRRRRQEEGQPDPENTELEMPPKKAARFYARQMPALKTRALWACAVCVLLVWVTLACGKGWPLPGSLQTNLRAVSLFGIVAELTVMLLGLDVVTAGIMAIVRGRPGAESLIVLACAASLADAAAAVAAGGGTRGMPFCAAPALSVTAALWAAWLSCKGYKYTFLSLFHAREPYVVTREQVPGRKGEFLIKSRRDPAGFVRRSEEPNAGESLCGTAAPFLAAAALCLSLLLALGSGDPGAFFHIFAVMTALCAALSWLPAFPLLFARAARHLMYSGSALAGWSGAQDIGSGRRLILTDTDIFPEGTVEITGVRMPDKTQAAKVISYTGSMLSAAGTGLAAAFLELMRRSGSTMQTVEEFTVGEGGAKAYIQLEEVRIGTAGYMHLSGVKLPSKLKCEDALYTSIGGVLAGVFLFNYRPTAGVQKALSALRRGRRRPLFALRDFNVDPLLISRKFRVSSESFEFPTVPERYRISGIPADGTSAAAAVLSGDGLDLLTDVAECGTRLYAYGRISAWASLASSVLGMALLCVPCWTGSWTAASAANAVLYMLLWLLPVLVMAADLRK